MKRKINLIIVLLLVAVSQPGITGKVGKTGWQIFRKARSAKFKPITVTPVMAVRGDLSGAFYNPAVLAMNIRKEIFILSELGLTDDVFGGALYGHPLKDSAVAAGLIYYDAGKIELNWLENGSLKSDNVSAQTDLLGIVSYGRKISNILCVGVTGKIATSKLVERASANAFAADIGFLYLPKFSDKLSITGSVQNLGSSTKFVEKSNPLPFSGFVGAGYWINYKGMYINPGCDVTYLVDEERFIPELGFELGKDPVSINMGYRFLTDESAWHIGFTVLKNNYDIAYGYLPGTNLDTTHRLSIGIRFGKYYDNHRK